MLLSCIHPTLGKKSLMKVISNIVVVCIWMPKKCVLLSCIFSPVQISKKERKKKKGNFKVLWYFIMKCLCFVILDALDISCMWQFYLSSRRSFIISVENIKEKKKHKSAQLHTDVLMNLHTPLICKLTESVGSNAFSGARDKQIAVNTEEAARNCLHKFCCGRHEINFYIQRWRLSRAPTENSPTRLLSILLHSHSLR